MAAVAERTLSSIRLYNPPEQKRKFYQVGGRYQKRMDVVSSIFRRILEPLYGSQEKAIDQIRRSEDRRCFLLYEEREAVGVLQFKTEPSDEYAKFGVSRSIEVKSLFIDQSAKNSGRGLGSLLVDKLWQEVAALSVEYTGVHLTVSESRQDSLAFFKEKGLYHKT